MKTLELADRYAQSVFELAEDQGETEALRSELGTLTQIVTERPEIMELFQSPLITQDEKFALVEGIQPERSSLFEHFLMLLIERRRVDLLSPILARLAHLSDQKRGLEHVTVVTARPLDQDLVPKLQNVLERLTGKEVVCETKTDPALIGGMQIHFKNRLIDGTVRQKLGELANRLKKTKV